MFKQTMLQVLTEYQLSELYNHYRLFKKEKKEKEKNCGMISENKFSVIKLTKRQDVTFRLTQDDTNLYKFIQICTDVCALFDCTGWIKKNSLSAAVVGEFCTFDLMKIQQVLHTYFQQIEGIEFMC